MALRLDKCLKRIERPHTKPYRGSKLTFHTKIRDRRHNSKSKYISEI